MATVESHDHLVHERTAGPRPSEPRLVVETVRLRALLVRYVEEWQREWGRPQLASRGHRPVYLNGAVSPVSPVAFLASASGVGERTIETILGAGRDPRRPGTTTMLRTADALVAAIGRPDVFHDGTLPVMRVRSGRLVVVDADEYDD